MEADAIAEGFKLSVSLHGLKYNKLIGKYQYLILLNIITLKYSILFLLTSNNKFINIFIDHFKNVFICIYSFIWKQNKNK